MAKYVRIPVVVEAEQFFRDGPLPFDGQSIVHKREDGWYVIDMDGRKLFLYDEDWAVIDPRGDGKCAYRCKPDIFNNEYRPFSPDPSAQAASTMDSFEDLERIGRQRGSYLEGLTL